MATISFSMENDIHFQFLARVNLTERLNMLSNVNNTEIHGVCL